MAPHVLVSYDGTSADRDALELGRVFHELGSPVTLAYVRHAVHGEAEAERHAAEEADARLAGGAELLGDPSVDRRTIVNPATGEGLAQLAAEIGAEVIVFGSDYRTPPGRVAVGRSAQTLLESGPAALAFAPAGYRPGEIASVGLLAGVDDPAASETAHAIAERHGARVLAAETGVDLLLVGSRPEAPHGRVMVSARAGHAIEEARCPVLVLARGAALSFSTLVAV